MHERFRVWRVALMLILLLASVAGRAQGPVPAGAADPYAAVVPVTEQSNAELRRGAGIGLREVLVRISGRSDAVRAAALGDALADAGRYVDQYRYERNAESGGAPWLLQLKFSPNSIAQLLRGAGLPVWAGSRPAVQLWLATEEGGRRAVVDEQSPLAPALRAQAQRRGLPLHFPRDPRALAADDVWQAGGVDARAAALAGPGEVVVLGRLALQSGRCGGAWMLPGLAAPLPVDGDTAESCLAAAFDRVADTLAQQYAVSAAPDASAAGSTVLRVAGVDGFNAYVALLGYLKQIGAIKVAALQQVDGDVVVLQLRLEGGVEQLVRQLALDNRLAPAVDAGAMDAAAQPATLHYRWQAARG